MLCFAPLHLVQARVWGWTMCWRVPVMLLQSSRLMGLHPCHGFGWQVWPRVMTFWGSVLAARTSWREPPFHTNINQEGDPCHSGQAGADTGQPNENLRVWTASSKVMQGQTRYKVFSFWISIWRTSRHFDIAVQVFFTCCALDLGAAFAFNCFGSKPPSKRERKWSQVAAKQILETLF